MGLLNSARRRLAWSLALISVLGCTDGGDDGERVEVDFSTFVPVQGVVKVQGQPLAHAVVTFLPTKGPTVGTGETNKDGRYALKCMSRDGLPPGRYKVAVSYLVAANGNPQGLGARSAQVVSAELNSAKERLPVEVADLGRTKLSATVGPGNNTFDFDLDATLPTPPEKSAGAKAAAKPEATETGTKAEKSATDEAETPKDETSQGASEKPASKSNGEGTRG